MRASRDASERDEGPERSDPLGALVRGPAAIVAPSGEAEGGPLSGTRFVAKDVVDVAGTITGAGNPDWAAGQEPAPAHAAAVAALLGAGAELAGKGQCAELAFSLSGDNAHYGMPLNAAAPERDPGGSTSGPAAAAAGGLCDLGLGTDTLGSVRLPASYCGLYGYRPTHGAISAVGVLPLAQRFDTVGLLAGDPGVLRRAAEVLLDKGEVDGGEPPRRLLLAADALSSADPEVAEATRRAAQRLGASLGATLDAVSGLPGDPPGLGTALAAFSVLQRAQVWRNFGRWVEAAQPTFGPDVGARFEQAAAITPAEVAEAEPIAASVAVAVRRLGVGEALVVPSAGTVAPARDADGDARERARTAAGRLTCLASLAGAPAVSVPLASVRGLPVGIGLVARPGADRMLLAAAERADAERARASGQY